MFFALALFTFLSDSHRVYAAEVQVVSDREAQRADIQEIRRIQTLRLDALARECDKKFVVTQCLDRVHTERLAIETRLNRQVNLLNDAIRLERGREQKERNREKLAANAEKFANLVSATAAAAPAKQPKLAPQAGARATDRQPADPQQSALSASERAARTKAFERKQSEAIAKRAEVAKRLKDAGDKKPSLPKPD